jgi:tetratricopeptide (TPR) repeat protein
MFRNADFLEPMENIWPFLFNAGSEEDAKLLREALVLRANVNRLALAGDLDKACSLLPDDIRYRRMKLLYEKGPQYVSALVDIFRDDSKVLELLAVLRLSGPAGLRGTIPIYQRILKLDPKNVNALTTLGAICISANLLPQAENYLTLAVQQQPDYFAARYNLGLVFYRQGRAREAVPHLRYCLSKDPDNQAVKGMLAYIDNLKSVPRDNNSVSTPASKIQN